MLDELGDAFGDLVDGITDLASDVWGWIEENADLIAQIGDVLSTIGNVLGVVALATSWIPGVNAVTAAAAIGVSAAAAGTKLLAKAAGADVSWGSIGMDALGVIPGGKVVAGAKNAATQTIKMAGVAKVAADGSEAGKVAKLLSGTADVAMESKTLSRVEGVTGKVTFSPTTMADLKANPTEAIQNAAVYTHAKSVNVANKIPGVNVDPFSTAGIATGVGVESVKGVAKAEAKDYAADKITGG